MGKAAVQGEPMMDPSAVFAMLFGRSATIGDIGSCVRDKTFVSMTCHACSCLALVMFRRIPPFRLLFKLEVSIAALLMNTGYRNLPEDYRASDGSQ